MAAPRHRANAGPRERQWYILSSHGVVLFYVAFHPGCTVREISEALFLTPRSVWGTIGQLRRAGMVQVRRDGRLHRYVINLDAPAQHPLWRGRTLREVLTDFSRQLAKIASIDG